MTLSQQALPGVAHFHPENKLKPLQSHPKLKIPHPQRSEQQEAEET